jgi:hypothetical protein
MAVALSGFHSFESKLAKQLSAHISVMKIGDF